MENAQVADIFDEIADLIELQGGNAFRIRSYRNAARTVRDLSQRLEDLAAAGANFADLANVGKSTAGKIQEILDTGTCERLKELRAELPDGLPELMQVPQIGPRKAMQLYEELGVSSLEELKAAAEGGNIRDLDGMGEKTEENILRGLAMLASSEGRFLYHAAADHVAALGRFLDGVNGVTRWEVAGSFRRRKETVGDLDVLIHAGDRDAAREAILAYDRIDRVASRGREKSTVYLSGGLQVDFRFFEPAAFGAALMYFTGSKDHNIALRRRAQSHDWKLNEYGLFSGDKRLAGKDERSVYSRLNLPWIAPELREARGEIDAADGGELPALIEASDVRGDLQCHTTASDGTASIAEMAAAARERGYQFLAITDHSQRVTVANGLDAGRMRKHADAIREVDADLDGFWLLAGVEVDILKDGSLDLPEDLLAELDWVVASIHYDRAMSEAKMTERLLAAVRSGVVHTLGHPLGRIIGRREPLAFDADKVFAACAGCGVRVEINAQADRLDLPDTYVRRAKDAGVGFTFGTDAHKTGGLALMPLAVNVARRGWLTKADVLNTRTAKQLKKDLKRS
ncbi:MAG: DNA polymerase/3'-5' exonuclease PolX [Phycisphaerae bacterium]|nr:DNA polymerase/3'-5' exonuclease PolX [Phycisphaerae bacterium]